MFFLFMQMLKIGIVLIERLGFLWKRLVHGSFISVAEAEVCAK